MCKTSGQSLYYKHTHTHTHTHTQLHCSYAQLAQTVAGELCLTDVLEPSEYSYFNPTVVSMWAGPQHWKLRPRNREMKTDGQRVKYSVVL